MEELGQGLEIDLTSPKNGIYTFQLEDRYTIQVRPDQSGHYVLFLSKVAELPPGAFATRVFKRALLYNGSDQVQHTMLGYSLKTHCLIMHNMIPLKDTTGEELTSLFATFYDELKKWSEAIANGQPGPAEIGLDSDSKNPPPFGLKL